MSQKRATQRRWIVHRTFEPDRLSSMTLIQAYAHLVPAHIRVLRLPAAKSAAEGDPDARPAPLSGPARLKLTELTGPQSQRNALVIEPITKKEAG
jgi:hypothetical protein